PERKRPLPYLPRVIGVVTSPTGSVIRDILHRLNDRFPLHVLVWPVRVQGETSAGEVARAIVGFNGLESGDAIARPDVLIVARGGGSVEDLWSFNEEIVARAAADSDIPLISAVGHETDTTLIDYVSDVRAPTPTGAAEIVVPVKAELEAYVAQLGARLHSAKSRSMDQRRERLRASTRGLPSADALLAQPRQKLDGMTARLQSGLDRFIGQKRLKFAQSAARVSAARLDARFDIARSQLERLSQGLPNALQRTVSNAGRELTAQSRRLQPRMVDRLAVDGRAKMQMATGRLDRAAQSGLASVSADMERMRRLLYTLSYKNVLARGFALVRDETGAAVRTGKKLKSGQTLQIEFGDQTQADAIVAGKARGQKSITRDGDDAVSKQGSLL
ncbi:MAG: exodeoxyribonuclease VII large subunit, partial [Pseudomonadota bacterium]